ncbi:MAG: hypothetical protein JNL52_09405 [Flavobacteriales bacterium]|nr:hypothetical protein [Flavobacteriales bacterium]
MLLVLFVVLWSVMAWTMSVVLGYGLISEPLRFPEMVLVLLTVLAAAVLSTSWIIWQLKGKEVLEIDHEGLHIWCERSLFKHRLSLRLDEVEFIRAEEDRDTPWWIRRQLGIGGGDIVIGHNGRKRRWGIDLNELQAAKSAEEIRRVWEKRTAVLN